MDFDKAIESHRKWKEHLRAYLVKPDRSLTPRDVASDDKCELGKWIAGERSSHGKLPEFQRLQSEHARFHKAAAEIVRKADSGTRMTEEAALGSQSEFNSASSSVVKAIMDLKAAMTKQVLVSK